MLRLVVAALLPLVLAVLVVTWAEPVLTVKAVDITNSLAAGQKLVIYAFYGPTPGDLSSASWVKLTCTVNTTGTCSVVLPDKTFGFDLFLIMYNASTVIGEASLQRYHICYFRKIYESYITSSLTVVLNCTLTTAAPVFVRYRVNETTYYWASTELPLLIGGLEPRPLLELRNYYPAVWIYTNISYTVAAPVLTRARVFTELTETAKTFEDKVVLAEARGGNVSLLRIPDLGDYEAVEVSAPGRVDFIYEHATWLLPMRLEHLAVLIGAVAGLVVGVVLAVMITRRRRRCETTELIFV